MAKHFQRKGKRFLGWDLQDWIKGFFGSNATLSIIILFFICFYLVSEAIQFFPTHHKGLQLYRQTGQEYVGHIIKQVDGHTRLQSLTNQAYYQELDAAYGTERGLVEGYDSLIEPLEDEGDDLIGDLEDARDDEDAEAIAAAQKAWDQFAEETLSKVDRKEIDPYGRLDDASWTALLGGMKKWDPVEAEMVPLAAAAKKKMDEGMAAFGQARDEISSAKRSLKKLQDELVKIAAETKKDVTKNIDDAASKISLEKGIKAAKTEERKAELQKKLDELVILEVFPFEERTEPIRAAKPAHKAAVKETYEKLQAGVAKLPNEFASEPAAKLIKRVREGTPDYLELLEKHSEEADEWAWDKRVDYFYSTTAFFFGTDWITNSSWHDFYGLLPIFTGSVMISLIALSVAVPFSVGAAIYVNRIATRWEQNLIKPMIELVQAIPSVVLGIFGILVLGEQLREISNWEALSWIPGFPMTERLNVLNAGLLLALMAVPTVFTLCEDALNNVPRQFSEASFALGASRLQTILKVILPTAISGILAAILLGLGRVIGETMVVLLVAGNKIAMPEWSAGVGVIAQPTHTMTGIIAQEMGEVAPDTLHWRALFLVGLVLFTISLIINVLAQRVIRRLGHGSS
ncbi:MAG: phosphate ABC transporter permease subunit PstC [Akkermansiaceae bacterium]